MFFCRLIVSTLQMQWFPGPYVLACQVTQKNKALLVVFVDDGSENSQEMNSFWEQVRYSSYVLTLTLYRLLKRTLDAPWLQYTSRHRTQLSRISPVRFNMLL